jgi:hypothetical protein
MNTTKSHKDDGKANLNASGAVVVALSGPRNLAMEEPKVRINPSRAGHQGLTVPIPEHGFSKDILRDDPRLGVGLARDGLKVPLIRRCLIGDVGSVDGVFDGYKEAREISRLPARIETHLRRKSQARGWPSKQLQVDRSPFLTCLRLRPPE